MNNTQQQTTWKKSGHGNWTTVVGGVEMFAMKMARGWYGYAMVDGVRFTTFADFRRQIPAYLEIEMEQ